MNYLLVRADQVFPEVREEKEKNKKFFTRDDLIQINCLSRIEVTKLNLDLNFKMMICTEQYASQEIMTDANARLLKDLV